MKRISTIVFHMEIIRYYTVLICDFTRDIDAVKQTATHFNRHPETIERIIKSNQKYYKSKRSELTRCGIKLNK